MDREIKEELQKQRDERIEIVRKELAWESEKQRISLEKLRKRSKLRANRHKTVSTNDGLPENEIPESDSGTGNDYFRFCR
jgi:hypothetical protein